MNCTLCQHSRKVAEFLDYEVWQVGYILGFLVVVDQLLQG